MAKKLQSLVVIVLFMSTAFPPGQPRRLERPAAAAASRNGLTLDHVEFVQSWTPTACNTGLMNCIKPLPLYYTNNFSMHGLWPADATGISLPAGPNKPVPGNVFQPIEAQMNTYWANLNAQAPSHAFWLHEWTIHGTAGNWGPDGAQKYFIDGIKARQNMDLLSILTAGGIVLDKVYTKADIVGAISTRLPAVKNVYISCRRIPGSSTNLLYEILFCLDKNNLSYITCPVDMNVRGCFGGNLQIPSDN